MFDVSFQPSAPPQPTRPPLWRVKHWAEIGVNMTNRPEVIPLDGESTNFGESWQWLSYYINTTANTLITANIDKNKWRAVHDHQRAFHNKTGFDRSGDPRRDFVNNRDTSAPLPKWDKTRCCGGAVVTGRLTYSALQAVMDTLSLAWRVVKSPKSFMGNFRNSFVQAATADNTLMISTLNGNQSAPSLDWLLAHPWYMFDAVNVGGSVTSLGRFPQSTAGNRVFIPLVSNKTEVAYPLVKVERLPDDFSFETYDPYKV